MVPAHLRRLPNVTNAPVALVIAAGLLLTSSAAHAQSAAIPAKLGVFCIANQHEPALVPLERQVIVNGLRALQAHSQGAAGGTVIVRNTQQGVHGIAALVMAFHIRPVLALPGPAKCLPADVDCYDRHQAAVSRVRTANAAARADLERQIAAFMKKPIADAGQKPELADCLTDAHLFLTGTGPRYLVILGTLVAPPADIPAMQWKSVDVDLLVDRTADTTTEQHRQAAWDHLFAASHPRDVRWATFDQVDSLLYLDKS